MSFISLLLAIGSDIRLCKFAFLCFSIANNGSILAFALISRALSTPASGSFAFSFSSLFSSCFKIN
jgi:hypothetical protein